MKNGTVLLLGLAVSLAVVALSFGQNLSKLINQKDVEKSVHKQAAVQKSIEQAAEAKLTRPIPETKISPEVLKADGSSTVLPKAFELADQLQERKPRFRAATNAAQFVELALLDLDSIDPARWPYIRHVAIQPEVQLGVEQVSLISNSVLSRSSNLYRAASIAQARLARIELDLLAPTDKQLFELVKLYELLSERDTFFSSAFETPPKVLTSLNAGEEVEVTFKDGSIQKATFIKVEGPNATVRLSTGKIPPEVKPDAKADAKTKSAAVPASNQNTDPDLIVVDAKFVKATVINQAAGGHLGTDGALLRIKTKSSVPIMELSEFVAMTSSTINDGLYYELAGITPSTDPNVTDLDKWLQSLGASIAQVEALDAKSKVYIRRSRVTKRSRIVTMFYGVGTKPDVGPTLITLTFDSSEEDFDENSDPSRNLSDYDSRAKKKFFAIEGIAIAKNGTLQYTLFDRELKLQRSVPDVVASDFEAPPDAGTRRIFCFLSCARCHDARPLDESSILNSGWQSLRNDALLYSKGPPDILADFGVKRVIRNEDLAALESEYSGDPTGPINLARITYSKSIFSLTTKETWETIQAMAQSYHRYTDSPVTPRIACRDLGFEVEAEDAAIFLGQLLTAVDTPENTVVQRGSVRGIQEDIAIADLMLNQPVNPPQWRLIRKHAMLRSYLSQLATAEKKAADSAEAAKE